MKDSEVVSVGKILSDARKKKRLRYKKLSSELKIDESYLVALEEEKFSKIPGGEAYIKGFLRAYAKKLDLNPDSLIDQYSDSVRSLEESSFNSEPNFFQSSVARFREYPAFVSSVILFSTLIVIYIVVELILETNNEAKSSEIEVLKVSQVPISDQEEQKVSFKENQLDVPEKIKEITNKIEFKVFDDEIMNKSPIQIVTESSEFESPINVEIELKKNEPVEDAKINERIFKDLVVLKVFGDCWLEVYSENERLLYQLAKAGEEYTFEVTPVKVIAGNSKNIELSYNGEIVSLDYVTNKNRVSCIVLPSGACSEFRTPNN